MEAADEFNRRAMITKLGSDGVIRPLSTDDRNARLKGAPASAWDRLRAMRRRLISLPRSRANGVEPPASECLAIVDSRIGSAYGTGGVRAQAPKGAGYAQAALQEASKDHHGHGLGHRGALWGGVVGLRQQHSWAVPIGRRTDRPPASETARRPRTRSHSRVPRVRTPLQALRRRRRPCGLEG